MNYVSRKGASSASKLGTRRPLAIVGIGCRFPGDANDPEAFWSLLSRGVDALSPVPPTRWNVEHYSDQNDEMPGTSISREAGFIKQKITDFDADFFGILPREAACLDPQQRILLETAWEALEDAGIPADQLIGSLTGVYVGGFTTDSLIHQLSPANRDLISGHTATSATLGMLANRLSYSFDFRGPSITIDTACSSSLVALNYACRDLWSGDCSIALAAGVNIMFKPEYPIAMSKGGFLAADSRSKTFDSRADGYARGEGAGVVVLKPLDAALADGDRIYALIRGTGVNQDGRTSGITVPNPVAQEALIRRVYEEAGVEPHQISFVEAHGTGTPVGDPIETRALGSVVGQSRGVQGPCLIGSVKANIGHLEAAAGVAGTIKAALVLSKRRVPPQIHIRTLNPNIPFADLGLRVPLEEEALPRNGGPACVSVNSFGFGGTNAHAVLEEPPEAVVSPKDAPRDEENAAAPHLLLISARSPEALSDLARAYVARLSSGTESFFDFCRAAALRRSHHRHRLAVVAASAAEACEKLEAYAAGTPVNGVVTGFASASDSAGPVFLFTGMGPQWWRMGRELFDREPVYRAAAVEADEAFRAHAGWSILEEMNRDENVSRMKSNDIAQPANFILQVGLTALWRSWGVEPSAVVGHSVGEISAAYLAGTLSLSDAALVAFQRSRCQQKVAGQGSMLAAALPVATTEEILSLYEGRVSIAAINAPTSLALAGDVDSLEEIATLLSEETIFNRRLHVEVAYHSHQMIPIEAEIKHSLQALAPQRPKMTLYSTVTSSLVADALHDADYWWRNVREPVRFSETAAFMIRNGHHTFLEIGPHPVLGAALGEIASAEHLPVRVLSSLKRGDAEFRRMLEVLAGLHCSGVAVNWGKMFGNDNPHLALPLYPWHRERHWIESSDSEADRTGRADDGLLGKRQTDPDPTWQTELNHNIAPYLWDHKVDGFVVYPGAAYVHMMLAAQQAMSTEDYGVLEDVRFENALVFGAAEKPVLRTRISDAKDIAVHGRRSGENAGWATSAQARLSGAHARVADSRFDLDELKKKCPEVVAREGFYSALAERGLEYGPYFQAVRSLRRSSGWVLAEIALDPALAGDADGIVHPTVLDASFQALMAALDPNDKRVDPSAVFVPVSIERVSSLRAIPSRVWCLCKVTSVSARNIGGEITIMDDDGVVLMQVENFRAQGLPKADSAAQGDPAGNWLYSYEWQEAEPHTSLEPISQVAGEWMIVSDDTRFGDDVEACLTAQGIACFQVRHGPTFVKEQPNTFRMALDSKQDWARLFDARKDKPIRGIAYLGGIEESLAGDDPTGVTTCTVALRLLQELAEQDDETKPRLFIVTRQVHRIGEDLEVRCPQQHALWGLGRVIMNEHPDFRCALIDFDDSYDDASIDALVAEFLADDAEDEVAFRGGKRFVHRLHRISAAAADTAEQAVTRSASTPFEMELTRLGDLSSLRFAECARRTPAPDEVELRIIGVSLNFKDVLKMLGVLSDDVLNGTFFGKAIGMEAAVEVVRIGDRVEKYAVGDRLVATLPHGCFRSYATVLAKDVHGVPALEDVDLYALAGAPIAFVTAYYGLHRLSRLRRGERVLLHAASGGVGLAAIQVARWCGAEVIATAGSEKKRAYLRSLGVEHVFDSRSLDFVDDVKRVTDGAGVDVVLNFLTGEAQDKSVSLLAPFGRFIEIGKRDIDENRGLGLRPFNRNLMFSSVDVDRMLAEKPELFDELLAEVWEHFVEGNFQPVPVTEYPIADLLEACQLMRRAEHMGKIVVRIEGEKLPLVPAKKPLFRANGSYLVTGGFGAFGLKVAEWMVDEGARTLVLLGRTGPTSDDANTTLERLAKRGVHVVSVAADISDEHALRRLFDRIAGGLPPLRGVFHAAAVLDDALLVHLDPERFARVMKAKAEGAWVLHRLTRGLALDYFVLFSSVSALVGNPGQANYGAANAFLDSLARFRAAQGLPATSINWGAIGEVGMAARDPAIEEWLNRVGIGSIPPAVAVKALGDVLRRGDVSVGVIDIDWGRWADFNSKAAESPKFSELIGATRGVADAANPVVAELAALDVAQRHGALMAYLKADIAQVLRLSPDRLDTGQALTDMGVDSLMMVEVQLAIEKRFGLNIPVMELSRDGSLMALADRLLDRLQLKSSATDAPAAKAESAAMIEGDRMLKKILGGESVSG